jgi:hypothetical protein
VVLGDAAQIEKPLAALTAVTRAAS